MPSNAARPRLLDHALARIDEHHGHIRRRSARDHVARVLHMARCIRHDELAARCGEVAVSDIDGDSLLALGAQAVGEIGEIDLAATGDVGGTLQRLELIFHEVLRVVKQAADERGLAVIHGAAGIEAQNFDRVGGHQK
jgi:hypothetical protein